MGTFKTATGVRVFACGLLLLGCSSKDDEGTTDAAGDGGTARMDASVSIDAAVDDASWLAALAAPVHRRIAVGARHVCALRSTRDVVCWGTQIDAGNASAQREDHVPLGGPFDTIDIQLGYEDNNGVCGMRAAGPVCDSWDESHSMPKDFTSCTQNDHGDRTFSIDRWYGDELSVIGPSGSLTVYYGKDCGQYAAPSTGAALAQVEQRMSNRCVRDVSGRVACLKPIGDGGPGIVPEVPEQLFRDIVVGVETTCGLTLSGDVRCWDDIDSSSDPFGFAADLANQSARVVQLVPDSALGDGFCALLSDGRIRCRSDLGSLYWLDVRDDAGVPVELAMETEVVCLVRADDTVHCVPHPQTCRGSCPDPLVERYAEPPGLILAPR